jgi:SAM-dependent methyltransferase
VIGTAIATEGLPGTCGDAFLEATTPGEVVDAISTLTKPSGWQSASEASRSYLRAQFSSGHLRKSLHDLFNGFAVGNGPLPNRHAVQDFREYVKHEQLSEHIWTKRRQHERELVNKSTELIYTTGYCAVCGRQGSFVTSYQWSSSKYEDGRDEPNWREHVACRGCGLVTRLRATIHHLQTTSLRRDERVYLTERVTPFYSYMAQRVDDITGSEYLGADFAPGQISNGVRHEDLQRLSFPDKSFDLIVSLDVLEHVPDYEKAFVEMYRCLKPGGRMVVAVPFERNSPHNIVRAELLSDGTLVHHLPPEYHGNPVDHEGGSLCYRYFGWDFLEFARSIGFSSATAYSYWSRRYQYLGTENWIFEFVR